MDRRRDDPEYQPHDLPRREGEREEPPPGATGPKARGAGRAEEDTSREVNRRINMNRAPPSEVREAEREHGSPDAVPEEEPDGNR